MSVQQPIQTRQVQQISWLYDFSVGRGSLSEFCQQVTNDLLGLKPFPNPRITSLSPVSFLLLNLRQLAGQGFLAPPELLFLISKDFGELLPFEVEFLSLQLQLLTCALKISLLSGKPFPQRCIES